MKILSFLILMGGWLFFRATPLGAADGKWGLAQALKYAVRHAPGLDSARRNVKVADYEVSNRGTAFLPSLELQSAYGFSDTSPNSDGNARESQVNLTLTENLFDNGEKYTRLRIAKLDKERLNFTYENEKQKIALEVAKEFYRFSLGVKLKEVQQEQFNVLNRQFKSISKQYRQGLKTRKDFLRFKTQLQRAQLRVRRAENDIRQSQAELVRIIGVPLESEQTPEFAPMPLIPLSVDTVPYRSLILKNHYEFRIAEIQSQINALNVNLVSRKIWPEIFVTGEVGYGSSNYWGSQQGFFDNDQLTWKALLNVKFTVWDWGKKRRDKAIAIQKQNVDDNRLTLSLQTLRSNIDKLMLNLSRLKDNYNLNRELLQLEQKTFDFLSSEYRKGQVTYLDLIRALENLSTAKQGFYTAHFDLLEGISNYRFHEGILYDRLVQK